MRLRDETPLDPEVLASLDAIHAVLAGEPVDPRHAELAELALLLAEERPEPDSAFEMRLDERVQRRFTAARPPVPTGPRRSWLWGSLAGLTTAAAIAVVVVASGGSSPSRVTTRAALSSAASSSAGSAAKVPAPAVAPSAHSPGAANQALSTVVAQGTPTQPAVLQPPPNGRKVIQGAQLALGTAPNRVDAVAQEVFDVVGQQRGIVNSSTVTATGGPGGYAQFQLSIPSAALPQTMAALSSVRYAHVTSRTDNTQDVNDQYQSGLRLLSAARALRSSLLKQLAAATTQTQINSLTAQIHDADASISSDEATLRSLNSRINYSQVSLTINAGAVPVPAQSGSGGFTLHKAAHDAGRVLTVAAGVALIALAALLPIGLLAALGWWVVAAIRRRRREQALDTA
jgi:hypothetical protein